MTTSRCSRQNPHGLLGFILDDDARTSRALQLLGKLQLPAMITMFAVSAALVTIALVSPWAAATLLGSGTAGVAGTKAIRARRRAGAIKPAIMNVVSRADINKSAG